MIINLILKNFEHIFKNYLKKKKAIYLVLSKINIS